MVITWGVCGGESGFEALLVRGGMTGCVDSVLIGFVDRLC